ncbi:GldG family protein [Pendulispora brunnea]|uniref:GldG family protein n=1 Tax=Pendulispora brunnea TaxID=2905690 RepID=A0ABZ2K525_9BACT
MERKARAAAESGVLLLVIAGILVALNALSALGVYKRFDTTKSERFKLSKGSGTMVREMKQSMQVDAYVTKGLPKLDAFVRDLRDLLQEYKDASGGKFNYNIIEAKDEETKKTAKDAGLVEQPFGEASATESEKAAVTMGFMGLVLKYGSEKDSIRSLDPGNTSGLEFWLTNKIREIRDKADDVKRKIGVLTGHDEMKLSEANLVPAQLGKATMQDIITKNFPFYTFQDVDLKNGDSAIDEALEGLIITQPGKDISEKELRRIDEFVMKGKSLAVFASAVNVKASDASMNATLNAHGLDKLLAGYGIELKKEAVLDFGRSFGVQMLTQGGIARPRFPAFLSVQDDSRFSGEEQLLDSSFPAFFRMNDLVFPFSSPLLLHTDIQPEATVKSVARSTPNSTAVGGETVDLKPFQNWSTLRKKSAPAQYVIAATVDGTLKTAFPSGDKQGIDTPEKSKSAARVFVLSASQFLANPFARAGNAPDMGQMGMMMPQMGGDEQLQQLAQPYAQQALTNTILSFKNTLDWLGGDSDLLAVSAKILNEAPLAYGEVSKPNIDFENETDEQLKKREDEMKASRKSTQNKVQWLLILGLPLLFSLYGVLRWRSRIASRENVSLA